MTINETSIWMSENPWIWEFNEYIISSYEIVIQVGSDKCIYLSLLSNKERVVVKSGSTIPEGIYPTDAFVTLVKTCLT